MLQKDEFHFLGKGACRDSRSNEPAHYECKEADASQAKRKCIAACDSRCLGWQICDIGACSELCVVYVSEGRAVNNVCSASVLFMLLVLSIMRAFVCCSLR